MQRLMRDIPVVNPVLLHQVELFVHSYVMTNYSHVRVLDFEEWLESTTYNEDRKNQLRLAHDELRGGVPTKHDCETVSSFGKTEFYPTWKHARMINSRSDAFKVWSGPMIKAIEMEVYQDHHFIKHVPVPERPALIRALKRAGLYYQATDFTAFESHFIPEVMNAIECQLYRWCLANCPGVDLLCNTLTGINRMKTRFGLKATVEGRRMSGDMCTSLGNGFTNLMLALYLASVAGAELDGYVEGDDGIFATTVPLRSEDYAALGFTIKIENVPDPCCASFCGMIFSESGEIVRDPRKFLQGFGWTSSFINAGSKIMDELLRAKALSTCYETPQCPIVGAMARYALRLTAGVCARFVNDGYHVFPKDAVNITSFNPSPDTRLLFEQLYGISIPIQLRIERAIESGDMAQVASLIPASAEIATYAQNYVTAA